MSSKQAQRASARKAQARRQKIAQQRAKATTHASQPRREELTVDLAAALDLGPEDHLPNGKVKLSAALRRIAGTVAAACGVRDAATFSHVMQIAGIGWNLAVLRQFPDLHPNLSVTLPKSLSELAPEVQGLVEIFRKQKERQFPADQRLVIEVREERQNGKPFYAVPNIDPDEQPGAKGHRGVKARFIERCGSGTHGGSPAADERPGVCSHRA